MDGNDGEKEMHFNRKRLQEEPNLGSMVFEMWFFKVPPTQLICCVLPGCIMLLYTPEVMMFAVSHSLDREQQIQPGEDGIGFAR